MFPGGVLMVSHDQHLIESTVDELWAVENGTGARRAAGTVRPAPYRIPPTMQLINCHQTMVAPESLNNTCCFRLE